MAKASLSSQEAELTIKASAANPLLESTIQKIKATKEIKIVEKEGKLKLQGSFLDIQKFFKVLSAAEQAANAKNLFIRSKEDKYLEDVEDLVNGSTWGYEADASISSTNVPFDSAEACYILLEKYEKLKTVLAESKSRLKFKSFSNGEMRIKIEATLESKKNAVKAFLEDESKLARKDKESHTLSIGNLINPISFLDATMENFNPHAMLLRKENDKWVINVLVDKMPKLNTADFKRHIESFCQKENGNNDKVCAECLGRTRKTRGNAIKENGIISKENKRILDIPKETQEISVGAEEIIDYMMKVKENEMLKAQIEYGVEIVSDNKSKGILIIKAKASDVVNAERWLGDLSHEMVRTIHQETIDLTKLNKGTVSESQLDAAKRIAGEHEVYIKVEGKSSLLIVGPRSRLSDFKKALQDCFSKSTTRRESTGGATAGRPLPSIPTTPKCAKAYRTSDGNITILTWITDITKLHVDAVVNAANERLQHGAGVALAIANAAGREFDKECSDKVKRFGKLATADVYMTTAGNMPSKKVIHTVGPIWREYSKRGDFEHLMWKTFNKCLEEAHDRGFHSIAFPAISSGIFGGPKDVIAKAAISAILAFCNKHPFTTVTSIHLVDILEDTILCFQEELDIYVTEDKLVILKAHDYSTWTKKNLGGQQFGGQQMIGSENSEDYFTDDEDTPKSGKNKEDNCPICIEKPTNPTTLPKCKHTFCKDCIDQCFDKLQPKCPICGVLYGDVKGTQPENGHMDTYPDKRSLPGYSRCGTIVINYWFPNGTQTERHPHPGRPYWGTRRTAYLPDNKEGKKVLALLQRAFDACMVFTVGRSSTTGRDNNVIWNCIHHKTNRDGGPPRYGYPDSTYLSRVTEELAAAGFK